MNIKWTEDCLKCQAKHGICKSSTCAKYIYDPWGDPYPDWVYFMDGNSRLEYVAEKKKRMEVQDK